MALSKGILELMNETSVAATATVPTTVGGAECGIIDTTETATCALELEAVFNADGTASCVFHVRASTVGGTLATEWDTVDYDVATLACTPGLRAQMTIDVDASPKYLTVFAVNEDGTYSMTSVKVTRAIQEVKPL